MEARQRFLELRRIFNNMIEAEVRRYLNGNAETYDHKQSKITDFSIRGDMFFLRKYILIGNGNGSNQTINQVSSINPLNESSTFIIPGEQIDECSFWLHLDHPNIKHEDRSYFIKKSHKNTIIYHLDSEAMLENDEFKKCILQMFQDIAPQWLRRIQELFV